MGTWPIRKYINYLVQKKYHQPLIKRPATYIFKKDPALKTDIKSAKRQYGLVPLPLSSDIDLAKNWICTLQNLTRRPTPILIITLMIYFPMWPLPTSLTSHKMNHFEKLHQILIFSYVFVQTNFKALERRKDVEGDWIIRINPCGCVTKVPKDPYSFI